MCLIGMFILSCGCTTTSQESNVPHTSVPLTGNIEVTAVPPGAEVSLDQLNEATTPHTYSNVTVGSHKIDVYLTGYKTFTTWIDVTAGQTNYVNAILQTPTPTPTSTSPTATPPSRLTAPKTTFTVITGEFSKVTHASVSTIRKNWDNDAEYDGITVHPSLKDASDETVKWSGMRLNVDIEIWSTKFDNNFKEVKDQLVYKGSGTISSWEDGNMFMGGGIQVPFSSMRVPAGESFGWTYATVHVPGEQTFSDIDRITALTP